MAISLRRAAPRASIMLATFSDAISRTTAAMQSSRMAGTASPLSEEGPVDTFSRERGRTNSVWSLFSTGQAFCIAAATPASCASAAARVMPGRSRPTAIRAWLSRAASGAAVVLEIVDHGFVDAERHVEFGADQGGGAGEALRGDADHREQAPVEAQRPAEHRGIGAVALPEGIADDHHRDGAAGALLFGGKHAAAEQRDAHRVEVVRRNHVGEQAARGVAFGEADHRQVVGRQAGENAALPAQIDEVGVGERPVVVGLPGVAAVEPHQFLGLVNRQRLQQEGVHQAENRGIGADTQSQNQHGGCGETRSLGKHPDSVRKTVHPFTFKTWDVVRCGDGSEKFTKQYFSVLSKTLD